MAWKKEHTKIDEHGADYSETYIKNTNTVLYIGRLCAIEDDEEGEESPEVGKLDVIAFKPFLKSFDISVNTKFKKPEKAKGSPSALQLYDGAVMTYKIDVAVPSLNVNEAKQNANRIHRFMNMLTPDIMNGDFAQTTFYVSLSNLIQSGNYRSLRSIHNNSSLKKYGLYCEIHDVAADIDTEMGFFEYNGDLWPKSYDLKFTLNVLEELSPNASKYHIKGLSKNGAYAAVETTDGKREYIDIITWPFGVK